jgi:hypothetical protein
MVFVIHYSGNELFFALMSGRLSRTDRGHGSVMIMQDEIPT